MMKDCVWARICFNAISLEAISHVTSRLSRSASDAGRRNSSRSFFLRLLLLIVFFREKCQIQLAERNQLCIQMQASCDVKLK
jgi:hypothetical protein